MDRVSLALSSLVCTIVRPAISLPLENVQSLYISITKCIRLHLCTWGALSFLQQLTLGCFYLKLQGLHTNVGPLSTAQLGNQLYCGFCISIHWYFSHCHISFSHPGASEALLISLSSIQFPRYLFIFPSKNPLIISVTTLLHSLTQIQDSWRKSSQSSERCIQALIQQDRKENRDSTFKAKENFSVLLKIYKMF